MIEHLSSAFLDSVDDASLAAGQPADRPREGSATTYVEGADVERGAVVLDALTKTFGSLAAVDDISMSVDPGEFLSLLGPSGCGKTTTLRLLAGFERPDSGKILISGQEVQDVPAHKRDVNTVFQSYVLFPHMTVSENVAFGLRQRKTPRQETRERVGEALEMVKMSQLWNRSPKQLSGGQQQRVALARALVNRPSVLLLDEPLGALDRKLREEVQIELKLLQSQLGITFIFVTHDQQEALSMSNRIAVMLNGRIQQLADPDTVYDAPVNAFVAGFIGHQNFFEGKATPDGQGVVGDGLVARSATTYIKADASPALAGIRPEAVRVSGEADAAGDGTNGIRCRLASVSHLGEAVQFVMLTATGQEVLARMPRALAPQLEVDTEVWCSWRPDDVRLFAGEDARGPERAGSGWNDEGGQDD